MGKKIYNCIRRTFCWLNMLIWICGCGFLGLGLWLHFSYKGYATLLPEHAFLSADALFLSVGSLSLIISFFGCCGSWFQSRALIIIYFSLVVVLFVSEFLLGSLAFVFRGGLGRILANELRFGIENHYNASDAGALAAPSVAAIWDHLQSELHCCGVTTYEDWYDIKSWRGQRWVPTSCCRPTYLNKNLVTEGSGDDMVECSKSNDPTIWFDKGCAESLQVWLGSRLHIVGIIALVIAFIQLLGLIASMLLFCTMKYNRTTHTYKSYSPTIEPTQPPRVRTYSDET